MAKIDKYLTGNTEFIVGIITQFEGCFLFGVKTNKWFKDEQGRYQIPLDLVMFQPKRGESIINCANRILKEEIGGDTSLTNLRTDKRVGIITKETLSSDSLEDEGVVPAYISIRRNAYAANTSSSTFTNYFIYSAKTNNKKFKILNMQSLFCVSGGLLKKLAAGNLTMGQALAEGLSVVETKIQIPDDSVIVPQKSFRDFMKFIQSISK